MGGFLIKGIGVSPGIAIGRVFVEWKEQVEIEKDYVDDVEVELDRLNAALEVAGQEIGTVYERTDVLLSKDDIESFSCHGIMIDDPEFIGQIKGKIITENVNAEWAVKAVADKFIQVFESMDDQYLKARADDVKDVASRVCGLLMHVEGSGLSGLSQKSIVLAHNFAATDVAQMDRDRVMAFVLQEGTLASHAVIMARNWGIPAVINVPDILDVVESGDLMIIDGSTGIVILNPSEETLAQYREKQVEYSSFLKNLFSLSKKTTVTLDGEHLKLYANVDSYRDISSALEKGISGIGLFRTECLYMDHDRLPTEGEQFGFYKRAVQDMKNKTVIFRTLDIGGDKVPSYLNVPQEDNPALGYRAIRLSLARADIFRTQLRAILKASAYGKAKVMFPMVSGIEEIRLAKGFFEDIKSELRNEGIPFNPDIEVGVMIEVPSSAVISDLIAKEVDFMSIGTNDLIQYTLAVDRSNIQLASLFSSYHPAVLRLVQIIVKNGKKAGVKVSLCGEMAGNSLLIPLLVGMGLDRLSMNTSSLLMARWIISNLNKKEMEQAVEEALELPTAKAVKSFCEENFGSMNLCSL